MISNDQDRRLSRDISEKAKSSADFNADDYRPFLEGLALDRDQADELLRIVWDMMRMSIEINIPPESWGQIVDAVIDGSADESADID